MAECRINISGYQCIKVRVEPAQIRGEGSSEYPRLVLPTELDLRPIGSEDKEQHFAILNIQCSLFLQDQNFKIADAINTFNPRKVHFVGDSFTLNIEFPLDRFRIESIEEQRKDDLRLLIHFYLSTARCHSMPIQRQGKQVTLDFLTAEFDISSDNLHLVIPKSHWVEKILPSLGYGRIKLIEIPIAEGIISVEFQTSIEELSHAEKYFIKGEYDKTVEHCRNAIEPINIRLPDLKSLIDSDTEYKWVKELGSATYDWIDKIYKKTRDLTAKPHHIPSVGHFSRHDAQAIMMVTTALLSYIVLIRK